MDEAFEALTLIQSGKSQMAPVVLIESAGTGAVAEGNVGAGTGTTCYGFKCGIGTSSRLAETDDGAYTVGALVQANHGWRRTLRIGGIPVAWAMATPVPALPMVGRVVLGALLLAGGLRVRS